MLVDNPIHINVTSRRTLEYKLETAVKQLQVIAMPARTHGILTTRHQPGAYTVCLSDQVPFGITLERIG